MMSAGNISATATARRLSRRNPTPSSSTPPVAVRAAAESARGAVKLTPLARMPPLTQLGGRMSRGIHCAANHSCRGKLGVIGFSVDVLELLN